MFTGLSGSGKSSLAFDTIYAEGQRRYVESLSAYARQFLEMMQKPDVDHIDGLSPAISIEQKTTSKNPRSTVGTVTEIYDYLRLLFARVGVPYSPATGLPIESQTVQQMVDRVLTLPEGTRLYLLAPIVRGRKGEYRKELAELQKKGFQRVKINGAVLRDRRRAQARQEIQARHRRGGGPPGPAEGGRRTSAQGRGHAPRRQLRDGAGAGRRHRHRRVRRQAAHVPVSPTLRGEGRGEGQPAERGGRAAAAHPSPLPAKGGGAKDILQNKNETHERITFSARFACPVSGFTIDEIEPRLFSFNAPAGACPKCDGLGTEMRFEADLVVPDHTLSLKKGAVYPWAKTGSTSPYYEQTLEALAKHFKVSMTTPWEKLPKKVQDAILYGTGEEEVDFVYEDGVRKYTNAKPFEGVIGNIERRFRETESDWVREELSRYQDAHPCDACGGYRLKPQALAVKIDGLHIGQVTDMSIRAANDWFAELPKKLTKKQNEIAARILKEIRERLQFLVDVGLDYLTLSRAAGTLSGGESQRIRLASQIGSGLTGVLYVLDEPSIGLHQRDNARLLETLKHLRDIGNTVIVVEHDEDAILHGRLRGRHRPRRRHPRRPHRRAGHARRDHGQRRQHHRPVPDRRAPDPAAEEAAQAQRQVAEGGRRAREQPQERHGRDPARAVHLRHRRVRRRQVHAADRHALQGGGAPAQQRARASRARTTSIEGLEHLDKVIDIDQSPIGRTPRSNPATYTGAFTPIREWFAGLPEAKARGYEPGRFSFNVKGGRCEACQGDGVIKIEMHFLPDVYVTCDVCKGKRYNRETLEVKFKDKSVADVLDMTVEEGAEFFKAVPSIRDKLETLARVGLGYIHIGQQATTLSGGEAQRIKLAKELSRRATGRTLYILDEPTTGLHFHDVAKLLEVLHELADAGNTVVVIEHNLEVIKTADWVIDMGPEGGDGGGRIVAEGTPEDVAKVKESYTGQYLKELLGRQAVVPEARRRRQAAGGGVGLRRRQSAMVSLS